MRTASSESRSARPLICHHPVMPARTSWRGPSSSIWRDAFHREGTRADQAHVRGSIGSWELVMLHRQKAAYRPSSGRGSLFSLKEGGRPVDRILLRVTIRASVMVRNAHLNVRPPSVTRSWRNSTGPRDVPLMARQPRAGRARTVISPPARPSPSPPRPADQGEPRRLQRERDAGCPRVAR
jgi:hypothetical protein